MCALMSACKAFKAAHSDERTREQAHICWVGQNHTVCTVFFVGKSPNIQSYTFRSAIAHPKKGEFMPLS